MIRVGFRLIGGAAWQGGRNYLWNLLYAIASRPERRVQPVLLVRADEDPGDLRQDGVECFATGGLLDSAAARRAGRAIKIAIGRNAVEAGWLRRARVDVLSHAAPLGRGVVPTISWVPDVQHRRLPQLSSRRDRWMRDLLFREIVRDADVVIVSSEAARADLEELYALPRARVRVLRFVSQPRAALADMIPLDELRARYAIPARYVHLPNQLWKHKNHVLVVEALRAARDVVVVATGPREDYRHAGVYDELIARVREHGLDDRFRHLGLVPFRELASLMHHAVAVVNPSRFEGWSTTVEEAKSLGKRVLLSDLPVHREQAPSRARYFGVDDAPALAALLAETWATHDLAADARAAAAAAAELAPRTRAFAEAYEAIVLDVARGIR